MRILPIVGCLMWKRRDLERYRFELCAGVMKNGGKVEGKLVGCQKVNLLLVTHGLVYYSCDHVDRVAGHGELHDKGSRDIQSGRE